VTVSIPEVCGTFAGGVLGLSDESSGAERAAAGFGAVMNNTLESVGRSGIYSRSLYLPDLMTVRMAVVTASGAW
jgi:hypothetical protein